MTTPLFMLRCLQIGLSINDMDNVSIGLVYDMFTELNNDDYEYPQMASQEDYDSF